MKIMHVEDSATVREQIKSLCLERGWEYHWRYTISEAFDAISLDFNALIIDPQTSDSTCFSGYVPARQLARIARLIELPAVYLSGSDMPDEITKNGTPWLVKTSDQTAVMDWLQAVADARENQ